MYIHYQFDSSNNRKFYKCPLDTRGMKETLDNYLKGGFVDVPRILSEGKESRLFPGLLKDVDSIRKSDFPLFDKEKRVYLDSTATSQEPQSVKDRMHEYRSTHIRGSDHSKNSAEAREAQSRHDEARQKLMDFFNSHDYIVGFTSGTTDSSNWVASRFPFEKGDALLITEAEHNSQILTARNMAKDKGVDVSYVPVTLPEGRLNLDYLRKFVSKRKKGKILLNLVHASNVSGVINPVREIRDIIGDKGFIYLDMAQSAGHMPIDLDSLDIDFAGISAHKIYGPMGIGAIFINKRSERYLNNNISGGSAVNLVSRWFTNSSGLPARFEPGTQDLEGVIEFGFALDYLSKIGMNKIEAHDAELGKYFLGEMQKIDGIKVYGPTEFDDKTSIVTFNVGGGFGVNHEKTARELDERGISVRDGCFCAHIYTSQLLNAPRIAHEIRTLLGKAGVKKDLLMLPGAVRASFAFYNNLDDAYKAVSAIKEISAGAKY
jgi:cysteine desulfurase/selenocysteine lyase